MKNKNGINRRTARGSFWERSKPAASESGVSRSPRALGLVAVGLQLWGKERIYVQKVLGSITGSRSVASGWEAWHILQVLQSTL